MTEFIGSGAMGSVYKAENINLREKKYAIKILKNELTEDASFQARFYQEAQNQSRLSHPNIVDVDDYFEEGGCYYLVLSFVDGRPLNDIVRDEAPLSQDRALDIFSGILEGLDCAHKAGIVHRDVKPSNVLIDRGTGRALITDFGIAIQAGAARMTSTGAAVGTAAYMSPEQIVRPQQVDHRSDVYSAGIVLYELLTGKIPFDGATEFAIHEQQVNRAPPDPRTMGTPISADLIRILFKSLEKDPGKRYGGCRDFLNDIQAYRQREKSGGTSSWKKWAIGGTAAGVVAAIAIVALNPKPIPDTGPVVNEDTSARNVAAAVALIGAGRQALAYFCNNLATIPMKENARQYAAQNGNSAAVDRFTKQIEDLTANAKDHVAQYSEDLNQLGKIDGPSIKTAFAGATAEDMQQWQNEVEKDHLGLTKGTSVNWDSMKGHCATALPRSPQ
ncbi:MAG: serine/threonine-protein kinase [Burkholderiaceae bacterium]